MTVICYYPGAGGNRLKRYFLNEHYDYPGSYDQLSEPDPNNIRNLLNFDYNLNLPVNKIYLTHVMDIKKVKKCFPNHMIYKIICDFKSALRRSWIVFQKDNNTYSTILNAYTHIVWYHNFYHNAFDGEADIVIDINATLDPAYLDFKMVMRQEFNRCSYDKDFEFAWNVFKKYGSVAFDKLI